MTVLSGLLLWSGVAVAVVCCVGLAVMRDFYEKLQYVSGVSGLAMPLVALAVAFKEGPGQASIKALLTAAILAVTNAALSHATARAARVRAFGRWDPEP